MMNINILTAIVLSLSAVSAADSNPYSKYPKVQKTASINGFADPIYAELPECAKSCVEEDTASTPCPYWDPGCLCSMPKWDGAVAECIAKSCKGSDVEAATSLAISVCSSAGVESPYWNIPATYSTMLESAAEATTSESESSATETFSSTIKFRNLVYRIYISVLNL